MPRCLYDYDQSAIIGSLNQESSKIEFLHVPFWRSQVLRAAGLFG